MSGISRAMHRRVGAGFGPIAIVLGLLWLAGGSSAAPKEKQQAKPEPTPSIHQADLESLRLAIEDLTRSFPDRYGRSGNFLARLEKLEKRRAELESAAADTAALARTVEFLASFRQLRREALLANPWLDFEELLLLKRERGQLGLPVNHKGNSGIPRTGYNNEIAVTSLAQPDASLRTLFRPEGTEFVGEIDLHWDADRLLFTMPNERGWQIFELKLEPNSARASASPRQITRGEHPDVDSFDACYLPDGRIIFGSTASFHAVPCWHGKERACSLYLMDADGGNVRQLCFDQDLDLYPAVLPTGQVIFSRWDYSGTMHMYLRPLMVMNPDGTGQRALYGSNSWWPNALYFARGIPGAPGKIVAVVAGYHGVPRMGELAVLDITKGSHEASGVVQRIPGRGQPVEPVIKDHLVDQSWPKFLHPWPLSEKYFLVAAQLRAKAPWGIYLVDVFDNIQPILTHAEFDFFEPIPLKQTPRPPVIPDKVDLARHDALIYVHDIYSGDGLAGVPRDTVKRLRVVAYHYGYPGLAGPDVIGIGGPWEVMRILGTVPVQPDGSAMFHVPANTPLTFQPLDAEGKAVQLMRTWFTAMPGENVSCTGCHDRPREAPPHYSLAALRSPAALEPWHGPARGFDFEREVQPVLDRHCRACHDGNTKDDAGKLLVDLRSREAAPEYRGRPLTKQASSRLHPEARAALGGDWIRYSPAYEALIPYIRRVGIEDSVNQQVPGEYHADTSELVQMLKKDHYGVRLEAEDWDRLVTWIDLNGPCHGTWSQVCAVPEGAAQRRLELSRQYGGPVDDPEMVPDLPRRPQSAAAHPPATVAAGVSPAVEPRRLARRIGPKPSHSSRALPAGVRAAGRPPSTSGGTAAATLETDESAANETQPLPAGRQHVEKTLDLGSGVTLKLVRIPAGEFVMGDADGEADEHPVTPVTIARDFWMGAFEISNEQFRRFDPAHWSGYFAKRFQSRDGPGLSLDDPQQPAVRVSWQQAMAFCEWLTAQTGLSFTLPTEAQWEYACRAGSAAPFAFGGRDADFSRWANLADLALSAPAEPTGGIYSNISAHHANGIFLSAILGGDLLCDRRFDDGVVATALIGSYEPNGWGLYDLHGNAAEWTRSAYQAYPYRDDDGRNELQLEGRKVVRGGSFHDRPARALSAFRLDYPYWQRVHNVGFRVVSEVVETSRPVAALP